MIEQNGSGLRVSGSMLIADAPALLTAGRGFLRTLPTGGDEVVFDLAAVTEADSSALGVIFALAAASFTTVQTASMIQDSRDRGSVTVNGTVALGAQVPVSADFDRLLLEGAVAAVAEEFPKIVGSEPVRSTGYGS